MADIASVKFCMTKYNYKRGKTLAKSFFVSYTTRPQWSPFYINNTWTVWPPFCFINYKMNIATLLVVPNNFDSNAFYKDNVC